MRTRVALAVAVATFPAAIALQVWAFFWVRDLPTVTRCVCAVLLAIIANAAATHAGRSLRRPPRA